MNTLTKVAVGIVATGLLAMYGLYLYVWVVAGHSDNYLEVAAHHAIVIFLLAVLYLIGLGIYKAWKAVTR
jgi:hypothetical protein